MNKKQLLDAIGNIDDSLLVTAVDPAFAESSAKKRKTLSGWLVGTGSVAAAIVSALVLILALSGRTPSPDVSDPNSIKIYMKINPYICITADENGDITDIEPLNSEGQLLLKNYTFGGKDADVAAVELIEHADELGYLTEENSVSFSIATDDKTFSDKYEEKLRERAKSSKLECSLTIRDIINSPEAKAAAMKYFGLDEESVRTVEIVCNADGADACYQVCITNDKGCYECSVDAIGGQVIEDSVKIQAFEEPTVLPEPPSDIITEEATEPVTEEPTVPITAEPTEEATPSAVPSAIPTEAPTKAPVEEVIPTVAPTEEPTEEPTAEPAATTDPASTKPKPPKPPKPGKATEAPTEEPTENPL